jgi:hypothetical protein
LFYFLLGIATEFTTEDIVVVPLLKHPYEKKLTLGKPFLDKTSP